MWDVGGSRPRATRRLESKLGCYLVSFDVGPPWDDHDGEVQVAGPPRTNATQSTHYPCSAVFIHRNGHAGATVWSVKPS